MSVPEPIMDNRIFDDIVRQSLELARRLCPEWKQDERGCNYVIGRIGVKTFENKIGGKEWKQLLTY